MNDITSKTDNQLNKAHNILFEEIYASFGKREIREKLVILLEIERELAKRE